MSCHVSVSPIVQGKSKVKLTLKQALKDQMGRYTSTLSLTLAQDEGGWQRPALAALYPGKRDVSYYRGGKVAPGPV